MKLWKLSLLILCISLTSCGARKAGVASQKFSNENKVSYADLPEFTDISNEMIEDLEEETLSIIGHALQFLGTKYKYGGTTTEGMDCSGLVYTSFLNHNIPLPRSSRDMAQIGDQLDLDEVQLGDLLFFKTDRRKKAINHVGLVVQLDEDQIFFIHSSTSRGVIISRLDENYWWENFVMARRIL